ncbi:hypothetical protein GTQ34_14960 [Muricauda sp. JGD-17]|uniref:DUF4179 domain-containing protein n=1 Tax=Flagellimonas ochracea TaxID=2696472 RepID=A0A964TE90_9FLAO|nr:hypothetical protein [Allomuricauda ochracea]NAY93212.1 hypothetical protein [Allomuricauda ochracea]
MEKDNIEQLFERLQGQIDFEEPVTGHSERFMEKLQKHKGAIPLRSRKNTWWKSLSIAASLALIAILGLQVFNIEPNIKQQVVKIAPEVSDTEFYFASLIEEQVQLLKDEKTPQTAQLVDDTLMQLEHLEEDYKKLEQDLVNGGDSKIILNAMINNFQIRIDLLKEVLGNIENIKNFNSYDDENITI